MTNTITLAVLSWAAHKTLLNTLMSYERSGLLNLSTERLIYYQEISPEDIEIAKRFGFEYEGNSRNIGISGGYLNLLRRASGDQFLFLENDWACVEDSLKTVVHLMTVAGLIESNIIDLARFRHWAYPGEPLWTRQFMDKEYERPTHLLDCIHWKAHPEDFPEITKILSDFYITTSKNANWTNNPHMAKTEWLRKYIEPRMNPFNDIERDIQSWWEQQDFKVGQGHGLFTHKRIG